MTHHSADHLPTEIELHQKSRILSITFDDDSHFDLPCEYLRIFSRAADTVAQERPLTGKEAVNITSIEPQGSYAVRLVFDDGHDTGLYSWDTLYELGCEHTANWQAYLQRLSSLGIERQPVEAIRRKVKLLYFVYLVRAFRKESEELELPPSVEDVQGLLALLRRRGADWRRFLTEEQVQVTVNKQFTEPFTKLHAGDEIAIVPRNPQPVDVI